MKEKSILPLGERVKKFFADVFGRPYLWFDFKYLPEHEMSEIVFEYNAAFLSDIADLGYDVVADPHNAVVSYLTNCIASSVNEDEDDE